MSSARRIELALHLSIAVCVVAAFAYPWVLAGLAVVVLGSLGRRG